MPKNIIICCDGTDNKLTISENSNVIHVYSCLKFDNTQIGYYHPGVGTIAPNGVRNWLLQKWYIAKDMVSASSLEENVMDAYIYLMNHYEVEDKIYFFGFSRGAYTVRMLSGLIEMFGLLHKGNQQHLRYALEIYYKGDEIMHMGNSYKKRFSRKINIDFIGIWDTVVAAGGLMSFYKSFPYSRSLGIAKTVRHALAIDEKRKHYYYYEVSTEHKDCKEVFFSGAHSDVGGSYPEDESGLSKIALEWMLGEASNTGLKLSEESVNRYLYGIKSEYHKPNILEAVHNSSTFAFKLFDFIPRPRYKKGAWPNDMKIDFRLWTKRKIEKNALIHESVFEKIRKSYYSPSNMKYTNDNYRIVGSIPIVYSV
jgi:uncharacterized protein (DUF2235 family)